MAIELQGGAPTINYANSVLATAQRYINNLGSLNYSAPTLSITWNSIAPPSLPGLPALPVMPDLTFDQTILAQAPAPLAIDLPEDEISEFTEPDPVLNIQPTPYLPNRTAPIIPAVRDVAVPDAPEIDLPLEPTYLDIKTVTFAGVDLHLDWLDKLNDIPTLTLVEPTPFSYAPGPEYQSSLLSSLKGILEKRLLGGTGLPEAAEQAIWDRARDRETRTALANEAEIQRQAEAFGFQLPSGVMAAQLRDAQKNYYDKVSELSRDIAIRQAELEQTNMQQTVANIMQLESTLIDYSNKLEQLAFQAAKALADNAVQIQNQAVEGFKGLLSGYQTYAAAYDTIIKGELAAVEVMKGELQGELAKAQINRELTDRYKASIDARLSKVKVFEGQLAAADTLMKLEGLRLSAAGEEIKAFVATVNSDTARIEAVKAANQSEAIKADLYETKARAFTAKVGAQSERSRARIARYTALNQSNTSAWEGYKVRIQAEQARIGALGTQSAALFDGYKASAQAIESQARMATTIWGTQITEYESSQRIALEAGKINMAAYETTRHMASEASKVAAQTSAQLAGSAMGQYHFSESNGFGRSVSYSYSNDTVTPAATLT